MGKATLPNLLTRLQVRDVTHLEDAPKRTFRRELRRMNFGAAFRHCTKDKMPMRLPHWKVDVMIKAQFPDGLSKMSHPYLYVESRYGMVPWMPTVVELFSEEWEVIDG